MKLVSISPTILINPDFISAIEEKKGADGSVYTLWVEGRSYIIEYPFEKFWEELLKSDMEQGGQHFGG